MPSACHLEGRICLQTAAMPFWSAPRLRKLHENRAGSARTIAAGARSFSVGARLDVPSVLLCAVLACLLLPAQARAGDTAAAWRAVFRRPAGPPPAPADNPMTPEKVALGARLFADPRLSESGQRACGSCHRPDLALTDGRRRARALSGSPLRRNTPSLFNLAWSTRYFWDGRAATLEEQVRGPIEAADEMGGNWPAILARLEADLELAGQFRAAFGDKAAVSQDTVVKALAAYVRSLVSPVTRFDTWIGGDTGALSEAEVRGFRLFTGKAGCLLCHAGWRFTDDRFHDIGLRGADPGRSAVPGGTPGLRAFKTPSLREASRTAPYMHDGSMPTLSAVVAHYAGRFVNRPGLAPSMNRTLRLSARERADLVAFLRTLSSEPDEASSRRRRAAQAPKVP
jgi:cytochrome c peroxidase